MNGNLRIWIVDDERHLRELTRRSLTKFFNDADIEFTEVENGENAINLLRFGDTEPPHIILLDMNMPLVNGYEFLKMYKQGGFETPKTLLYMLTASITDGSKARILTLGILRAIFSKELLPEELQLIADDLKKAESTV